MDAREWRAYVEPLCSIGERLVDLLPDPQNSQLRQEMYRHLYSIIAQGYFGLLYADAEYPEFWPVLNSAFNTLGANPDDAYYLAPIDGDGIYRISGIRGTVRILGFSIGSGTFFTRGAGSFGPTVADYSDRDLRISNDGSFEVLLSQTRPDGYQGDWWYLDPNATNVMVRQRAYDWLNEVDGRVAIERIDRTAIKPRANARVISERLQEIAAWAERNMAWTINNIAKFRDQGLYNKLFIHEYDNGGLTTQHYLDGLFSLTPEEALILETDLPQECLYWNFQLTDETYASIDWVNRQSSLNGHTARVDTDGKFRAVISARDPGVPNWLDTAGHERGVILGRWQESNSAPLPTLTKVHVEDVFSHLPSDTPMVSVDEREKSLRLRRTGAQMRVKW